MKWAFWIPGRFRLTNGMLSDLRAAGFASSRYAGRTKDRFNTETHQIRDATALAAKAARVPTVPAGNLATVSVDVFGHGRHDPDAGYLLCKAIIDGLAAAKVIASDRRQIWAVIPRVLQSSYEEELCAALALRQGCAVPAGKRLGAMVAIAHCPYADYLDALRQFAGVGHA